jgi:hypothetical protein
VPLGVGGRLHREQERPARPLFDWLSSGDVPLDESGGFTVSQVSYDDARPYWDRIGPTIVGRHVFDMTLGREGSGRETTWSS